MKSAAILVAVFTLFVTSAGFACPSCNVHNSTSNIQAKGMSIAISGDRIDIHAGTNASLVLEHKNRPDGNSQVIVSESSPQGFWPFLRGDIIKRINDRFVVQPNDVMFVFRESAGAAFNFEVLRNNQVTAFKAGPKDFAGLALPATPEPPVPPQPPTISAKK